MRPFVVATKLVAPAPRPRLVPRPALLDRLDAGVRAGRRLALVSAPPGYGKSTLISAWAASGERPVAWLSLDEGDDEPGAFAAGLVAACRTALPDLPARLEDASGPLPPTPAVLLGPLCNALAQRSTPLSLILEDYQAIRSRGVHDLVAYLLAHLPRPVHVVVVTREDPPLPLARLRARDELTEIRAADLGFDVADAHRFLVQTMDLELPEAAAAALVERTEGWIAGLQLAALSLSRHPAPDSFIAEFGATDRHIGDYLVEEVLARQPADVQGFMRATCVLDRMTGPLCDAMTDGHDGAISLAALDQANLFVVPLDPRRIWYRWHGLFAELLRSQLEPDERRERHRRAARWFAAAGLGPEALRHAVAAGDPDLATGPIEEAVAATTNRGEIAALGAAVGSLPAGFVARHPRIAVAKAWTDFWSRGPLAAEATLAALDPDVPLDQPSAGRLVALRAWIANRLGAPDARALAGRAYEAVDGADALFRVLACTNLGEMAITEDVQAAVAALEEARAVAAKNGLADAGLAPIPTLAYAYLATGRRGAAEDLCRAEVARCALEAPGSPMVGLAHVPLGVALYEADDLAAARQHLALGRELSTAAGVGAVASGAVDWTEIRLLHAAGERDAAWRRLELTAREARRQGFARSAAAMRNLAADLRLAEGDPSAAAVDLDVLPTTRTGPPSTLRELGAFIRPRLLIALGRAAEALASLAGLESRERADGCAGRLVTIDLLAALAHDQLRHHAAARARLEEALGLAAPEGYRRTFLAEGPRLLALLPAVRSSAPIFVDDLLARAGRAAPRRDRARGSDHGQLVEPLSARELEVLRLLAAGLSNAEIGEAIYVSAGTAKWHVHNILGKLGASSRVALVARAREFGLL